MPLPAAADILASDRKSPGQRVPGMFGYSLLRANDSREYFKALSEDMAAFGGPIGGLHTETATTC